MTTSLVTLRQYALVKPNSLRPDDLETALRRIEQDSASIRKTNSVPSNESVVQLLQRCREVASALVSREQAVSGTSTDEATSNATSSLLDLEENAGSNSNNSSSSSNNANNSENRTILQNQPRRRTATTGLTGPELRLANNISRTATNLLKDDKVFITPEALSCYTDTQTLLKNADNFPTIFHLYAHKPIPEENTSPVKYLKPNPKGINSAVPADIANKALDVAIDQKNLPLVLDIIDTTFCTTAFYRAKLFKKAAVPLGGLAAVPAASYAIASWASSLQNTMDPSTATGIALAAILTYVGGTSSMGVLAIVTANDQMERVVWMPGMPLRQRWLREEERAALDKVAVAWGFRNPWMRGEEEGEEWDNLHEFIGMRGMILDKSDLMPGMQ